MTGPDPRDLDSWEADMRQMFGGCTRPYQQARGIPMLPPMLAQARFYRSSDREIKRRLWWWRSKRVLRSREVRIAWLTLLLAVAWMCGKGFAEDVREMPRSALQRAAGTVPLPVREPSGGNTLVGQGLGISRASGDTEIQRAAQGRTLAADGRPRACVAQLFTFGVGFDEWRPAAAGMGLPTRDAPAGESSVHADSGRVAYVWSLRAGDSKFTRHSSKPAPGSMRGASDVPAAKHVARSLSGPRGGEVLQRRTPAPYGVKYSGWRESSPEPLSCIPSADGFLPPGCEDSSVSTVRDWLKSAALLLLLVGGWAVLHHLMFNDAPEDEGRVIPGRTRRPGR